MAATGWCPNKIQDAGLEWWLIAHCPGRKVPCKPGRVSVSVSVDKCRPPFDRIFKSCSFLFGMIWDRPISREGPCPYMAVAVTDKMILPISNSILSTLPYHIDSLLQGMQQTNPPLRKPSWLVGIGYSDTCVTVKLTLYLLWDLHYRIQFQRYWSLFPVSEWNSRMSLGLICGVSAWSVQKSGRASCCCHRARC